MRERDIEGPVMAIKIMTTSGRERDVAVWTVCADVVRCLDMYRRSDFTVPEKWTAQQQSFINGLQRMDEADLKSAIDGDPFTFGTYRNAVFNLEGDNARKLQTLGWVMQCLYRLRDLESADADIIDRLANKLGDVLVMDWRVKDVPITGDYRTWASRSTRRYDLLPKHWRWQ